MRKSYRVKKESEFQRVFETHNSVANRKFIIYQMAKPGQKHFRVGISVGKKIGNAVHRNWVKRRIRQTLGGQAPDQAGCRLPGDCPARGGWPRDARSEEEPCPRLKAGTPIE